MNSQAICHLILFLVAGFTSAQYQFMIVTTYYDDACTNSTGGFVVTQTMACATSNVWTSCTPNLGMYVKGVCLDQDPTLVAGLTVMYRWGGSNCTGDYSDAFAGPAETCFVNPDAFLVRFDQCTMSNDFAGYGYTSTELCGSPGQEVYTAKGTSGQCGSAAGQPVQGNCPNTLPLPPVTSPVAPPTTSVTPVTPSAAPAAPQAATPVKKSSTSSHIHLGVLGLVTAVIIMA